MSCYAEFAVRSVLIGVGATAAIDGWAWLLAQFGVPSLRMALLGRWLGHLAHGIWRHDSIASAPPSAGEARIGWAAHYAIGVSFAAVLLGMYGLEWSRAPTIGPAMAVGLVTVVAPLFVLQPGMGAGVASSRTARPFFNAAKSLVTHTVFGMGLYLAALVTDVLLP